MSPQTWSDATRGLRVQVITGATLVDGIRADPVNGASIVIDEDGQIVEADRDLSWTADAHVLDVGG